MNGANHFALDSQGTNDLLARFLRYVAIDTQSDDQSSTSPSTPKQLVLCHLLEDECRALGLQDVSCADNGIVMATVPSTVAHSSPTIVWNSHVDTSPEFTSAHVKAIVHHNYQGGDIVLPGDTSKIIRTADNPSLEDLKGTTIVTSDGTTLLGADDKAGIAVIMTTAAHLQAHPDIAHGPIRLCFTVDEEIGRGTVGLDMAKLGGLCGYTLDGGGVATVDNETFSADQATITVKGINTHPSEAKAKGMVNAVRILAEFLCMLPKDTLTPEKTDKRDGFIHPYTIEGGVPQATARIILRDFEEQKLSEYAGLLKSISTELTQKHPRAIIDVAIKRQYRNMRQALQREPRAVDFALQAMEAASLQPRCESIRGGTDGALLSEQGLPCPNLACGQHNPHSPLEWASLWEMAKAVEVLLHLSVIWGKERA